MANTRPSIDLHYRLTHWNRQRKRMLGGERCACGREWPCPKGIKSWEQWLKDTKTYAEP